MKSQYTPDASGPRPGLGLTGFLAEGAQGKFSSAALPNSPELESRALEQGQFEEAPVEEAQVEESRLEQAAEILSDGKFALLTGAGLSTDSGIPDYRGPGAPVRNPMTYQEFTGDASLRRRYWARNQLGWRHLHRADPNAGHFAVADLERNGWLTGLITQNVDRLHALAGSINVVDLHGRFDQVICLKCKSLFSRDAVAELIDQENPGFTEAAEASGAINLAPDADADLDDLELIEGFRVPDCPVCGGMLKPDFVFFGENVPVQRVDRAFAMLEAASSLLVAGSSLTVMSGLRFPRRAVKEGKPVVILNRGATRGDDLAAVKLDVGVSSALNWLAKRLGTFGAV